MDSLSNTAGLKPGVFVTVWRPGEGGVLAATRASLPSLSQLRVARTPIDGVQIHSDPEGIAQYGQHCVDLLRGQTPGVRLWFGVGVDGAWNRARVSDRARQKELDLVRRVRDLALRNRVECVVLNAEAAYKGSPAKSGIFARELQTATAAPQIVVAWSGFDHPTYHSGYPWSAWLGAGTLVRLALPQVYAAPSQQGVIASRGSLPRREAKAMDSWRESIRRGWVTNDSPFGTVSDDIDVDWQGYFQLHSVSAEDTTAALVEHQLPCSWALPVGDYDHGRCDANGWLSIRTALAIRRRGFFGAGAIQDFQKSQGLVADGIAGMKTRSSLGII